MLGDDPWDVRHAYEDSILAVGREGGGTVERFQSVDSDCTVCGFIRMCLDSSRRWITWSMSEGRFLGLVEIDSITRFDSACGTRGLSWPGVSIRSTDSRLLSPFLFTVYSVGMVRPTRAQ